MALSDDARLAIRDEQPSNNEWPDLVAQRALNARLPDGRTIAQALDQGDRLRAAVIRLIAHGPDTGHTFGEFMACYRHLVREFGS